MIESYPSQDLRRLWPFTTNVVFADRHYAVPKRDWLLVVAKEHRLDSPPYMLSWDCDDAALSLKVRCQTLHAANNPLVCGLAVGIMFYRQDSGGYHAINWSVTPQGTLWFLEPQTGEALCLSDTELRSVVFVYC